MNVIVCATPFQVLMAEKIIEHYADERFFGVMLMQQDNEKYAFYGQRLLDKCGGNGWIYAEQKQYWKAAALWDALVLKIRGLRIGKCRRLYASSVDSILLQTFISGFDFEELYTFDDGTANYVLKSDGYRIDRHQSRLHRFLKLLFRNPYDLHKLKAISQGHFTAFCLPNVMGEAQYLPLFTQHQKQVVGGAMVYDKTESILLGQPIYKVDKIRAYASEEELIEQYLSLVRRIINAYQIDYYFPHPRETRQVEGVAYLSSPLVAEDFFVQYFRPDTRYVLYTITSGAVLPFVGVGQVSIFSVRPSEYGVLFAESYDLMQQAGVNVIDLPAAD